MGGARVERGDGRLDGSLRNLRQNGFPSFRRFEFVVDHRLRRVRREEGREDRQDAAVLRHQGRQADRRHGYVVRAGRVPGRGRQDAGRLRRGHRQGVGENVRPRGGSADVEFRFDHSINRFEVRYRRLVVHHYPGTHEGRRLRQHVQGRFHVGGQEGQPRQDRHVRPVRIEDRGADRHHTGGGSQQGRRTVQGGQQA